MYRLDSETLLYLTPAWSDDSQSHVIQMFCVLRIHYKQHFILPGIKIIINTDGLNDKWEAQKVILQEYKEIFFGPDLTEEEIAELEKIANDDKHFTINLKFIIRYPHQQLQIYFEFWKFNTSLSGLTYCYPPILHRKKTSAEKEEERLAAEEEARKKAEENGEIVEGKF